VNLGPNALWDYIATNEQHLRVNLVGPILNFEMILWRMPVGIHGKPKGEQDQTLQQSQDWFLINAGRHDWIL
jgi:hypothetical protein